MFTAVAQTDAEQRSYKHNPLVRLFSSLLVCVVPGLCSLIYIFSLLKHNSFTEDGWLGRLRWSVASASASLPGLANARNLGPCTRVTRRRLIKRRDKLLSNVDTGKGSVIC